MRFQLRVDNWRSYIPILDVLRHYRRADFGHDLLAGIVVGIITVPQAVAYAFLAGLPPEAGLYACLVPMAIYAILGTSKHLVVGPVAIAALMVAAALGTYAPRYGGDYLGIAAVLCLQTGIVLWVLRVTQMGGLVNLLSHPVIIGFVNAAALLIILSQLPAITGLGSGRAENPLQQLTMLVRGVADIHLPTLATGLLALALLLLIHRYGVRVLRRFAPQTPDDHPVRSVGPVVVTVLAIACVGFWSLNESLDEVFGIAVVGAVPSGLPELRLPPFHPGMWLDLAPASIMIALVSYVESYSIATRVAARQRTRINSHQELIAIGAANIGGAFTGAYPVAGSFTRTSVNVQVGARTQVASLVCMAVIVLVLLYLTPLFTLLPHAVLAAIVLISVTGIVDLQSIRRHWKVYRGDGITELLTLLGVVVYGVEIGLLIGVGLSIAFFVRESSRPHVILVGRIPDTEHFRSARRYEVEVFPHVAPIRIDENIYFANANQLEDKVLKIVQRRPETRHVLLVCSAVNLVDNSGMEMLYRLNQNFDALGIRLHLSEVKRPVMRRLEATDFLAGLTGSLFFTTHNAMQDLAARTGAGTDGPGPDSPAPGVSSA